MLEKIEKIEKLHYINHKRLNISIKNKVQNMKAVLIISLLILPPPRFTSKNNTGKRSSLAINIVVKSYK